ncbi:MULTISPECIES: alpha/beta fold hydrolase [Streptomyces]|uniref:Alpha/beta hydrolase n=2 Tax=Streptomyces rimosus subsp. rimosus TaxID=132474 RepID=L8EZF0_STRR1|nr:MULTISPECIES: alpha/beta hydrolase [Streptomyces]KOG72979.1 alpha/beta hydrolase [Kitasatospora aureofaciens]MYT41640.1 alpha/beta fold hydrolase [Streptomyces sp. SID5471]KEF04470.1 alpha/beta hydrolase [Streptomyces rimosus]KEF20056.1 alpha/beta hydrolase [Streptomyces rimosus]KOT31174.1 alpha/beta hydrolase [Streptomyces rimosus subsp. rimosus]
MAPTPMAAGPYAPPAPRRQLTAASADGSRLYVEVHGPDGAEAPAVVLSHGWTCSTAFWAPVVRDLAADHKVIVYDQRGHGRTPAVGPRGYTTTALADDLVAVLGAALEPGERAVLAGHSMGGMTMMASAGRPEFRERAAAVLLCNTGSANLSAESLVIPLRSPGGRRVAHQVILGSRAPLGPVTALAQRILKYATMGPAATPEQVEACARIVHACPSGVRSRWGKVLAGLELTGEAARLDVPTAVIAGTADRLTPIVQSRRLASVLPDFLGLTELPGTGHMTPIEEPDVVIGRIRELVRDHLRDDGATAAETNTPAHPTAEEKKTA